MQTTPRPTPIAAARRASAAAFALALGATAASAQATDPSCYVTGGGTLEICRGNEAEGVFVAPRACEAVSGVQILRTTPGTGPLQAVYQAEAPLSAKAGGRSRRDGEACAPRRATAPLDGGSVRAGAMPEQLATTMPPAQGRLWDMPRAGADTRTAGRRRGRPEREAPAESAPPSEGIAARHPMSVAGRDWGGDGYTYVFFLAAVPTETGNRHALLQARTLDFTGFDIRERDADGTVWVPSGGRAPEGGRRGRSRRSAEPNPGVVLDESGAPVIGHCPGQGFDRTDLVGAISVVDRVYHYFYTDVLPSDCNEPAATRRLGLYLRTSRDLNAERVWSTARAIAQPLPNQSLVRVAKARDMDRWAVAYRCNRPANTMDGPVSDICVQYTADLSPGSLAALTWFSEPQAIMRSNAYLGLRSGGDGSGRFGRSQHFWMTDRYGNLATPTSYRTKAGFLTWLDRTAPGHGAGTSSVFGRPTYWGTWSVRPVAGR